MTVFIIDGLAEAGSDSAHLATFDLPSVPAAGDLVTLDGKNLQVSRVWWELSTTASPRAHVVVGARGA